MGSCMPPGRSHLVHQDYRTCHHKMWMLGALLLLCDHQQSFRAIAAENEVGRKFANCQCRGILAKTSRLSIEPRMWGSRSKRPLLGGRRRQVGSPLRARVCPAALSTPHCATRTGSPPLPSASLPPMSASSTDEGTLSTSREMWNPE